MARVTKVVSLYIRNFSKMGGGINLINLINLISFYKGADMPRHVPTGWSVNWVGWGLRWAMGF